jgi:hypothetical protein
MAATKLNAQQFADAVLSGSNADFVYLPQEANDILWTGIDPLYSSYEKWSKVVTLTNLLFGKHIGFIKETPDWLRAGCLFARICIQQCQDLKTKELLPDKVITRGKEDILPTYPYVYLGYARRCFNSGLGDHRGVEISRDDFRRCQKTYTGPIRSEHWKLCGDLADKMNTKGQELLENLPTADEDD